MRLKTTKDLVSWTCECNCVTFDGEVCRNCGKSNIKYGEIDFNDLKQEAIKHIKDAEYFIENPERDEPCYEAQLRDRINWIKHFFNITEKDLK